MQNVIVHSGIIKKKETKIGKRKDFQEFKNNTMYTFLLYWGVQMKLMVSQKNMNENKKTNAQELHKKHPYD